jgi:hypothetical protein
MAFMVSLFPLCIPARPDQIILCRTLQGHNQTAVRIAPGPIHLLAGIHDPGSHRMPRNILFLVIGALIVVVGVLGYDLYQTKKQPDGLQINLGPNGLKIQNK